MTNVTDPSLSVVIPTFDRARRLERVLRALDAQVTTARTERGEEPFAFEVIVVADGCTDDTVEVVRAMAPSYRLDLVEQANAGPAVARNRGVAAARADVTLFLDDDVVPEPGCLAAHVARRAGHDDLVVIGPMLTPTGHELSAWVAWEQHQLEKQYRVLDVERTAHHRQFYTGNASVPTAALRAVGGFDEGLRRAEDVELAQRLDAHGLSFAFEPEARAFHHAERSFESWREMAEVYGRNDVMFAQQGRPADLDLIRGFFGQRNAALRAVVRAVVPRPRLRRALDAALTRVARSMPGSSGRVGRAVLSALYNLRYYGGVADQLGGGAAFRALLRDEGGAPGALTAWFVLEQTLGHVTHGANLRSLVPEVEGVEASFLLVDDGLDGRAARIPGWGNWTVRAGVRARRSLAAAWRRAARPDVLFVHSQVPAVLLGRWMRRVPTVVSLDATPLQYDELGEFYRHDVGSGPLERLKRDLNRRCFARAAHLVTWSGRARDGLVADYGVAADDVSVVAPGVDVARWARPDGHEWAPGPLRVLFVGGDLDRKGGRLLLEAAATLRADADVAPFEVHLVTPATVEGVEGVVVHHGLRPNDVALIERYHDADVFCLPTRGDCLPMVLAEAGAAGLPLVSTDVGAISSLVVDGETGLLIPPDDLASLVGALRRLLIDDELRARLGAGALALVRADHDARRNAERIVDVLRRVARPVTAAAG